MAKKIRRSERFEIRVKPDFKRQLETILIGSDLSSADYIIELIDSLTEARKKSIVNGVQFEAWHNTIIGKIEKLNFYRMIYTLKHTVKATIEGHPDEVTMDITFDKFYSAWYNFCKLCESVNLPFDDVPKWDMLAEDQSQKVTLTSNKKETICN